MTQSPGRHSQSWRSLPLSLYWLIRLSPHWCAQGCPRDSPVHSWGPGGQAPKAGRDGVDFNLLQGWGAICVLLEHVV